MRIAAALHSFLLAVLLAASGGSALADEAGWAALAKPGAIVLFRHATAPGVGDPADMQIGVCATQRNLDERGRAESRRLGQLFRERGVRVQSVLHSQWCRTRDTARLAFEGIAPVREEPIFNSFFSRPGDVDRQTIAARALLKEWKGPGVLVVVTHQVNITQLTGEVPSSADGLVVRVPAGAGPLEVVGRVAP
ncbi:histidine phosphatase family protein [Caenimonas koreensis]|uniref:Histidine phosphatase family protein n=2 Tax=Caenimonas TaxID=763439 RepID=A0A844B9X3_9BURK|nr:histidine phosphatase family protein [Caenimonas koreensis DSM 17982]